MFFTTIPLWEKGQYVPQGDADFMPTLATYVLDGTKRRPAVLICPGGGYGFTSPREAEPVALQYVAAGFHAFVVYYSVAPARHPQPLRDVSRAMNIIRAHADDWHIEEQRIAVCGFSAGGHLAASLGVFWDQPYCSDVPGLTRGQNRPDALILCYPVISSGPFAHRGSFENLLGPSASPEDVHAMSLEHHIHAQTPPTFLWHTVADSAVPVENALLFAQGLRAQHIPFELHIYPHGAHGLSLATAETDDGTGQDAHISSWHRLSTEWLWQVFTPAIRA